MNFPLSIKTSDEFVFLSEFVNALIALHEIFGDKQSVVDYLESDGLSMYERIETYDSTNSDEDMIFWSDDIPYYYANSTPELKKIAIEIAINEIKKLEEEYLETWKKPKAEQKWKKKLQKEN